MHVLIDWYGCPETLKGIYYSRITGLHERCVRDCAYTRLSYFGRTLSRVRSCGIALPNNVQLSWLDLQDMIDEQ